jgi:hypothetical protein
MEISGCDNLNGCFVCSNSFFFCHFRILDENDCKLYEKILLCVGEATKTNGCRNKGNNYKLGGDELFHLKCL